MTSGLRKVKKDRVRRALFDAAIALFREKGFEDVSVEEIAERGGYSRATFFNHFKTKDGVLRFYGEHLVTQVEANLAEVEPGAGPLRRLRVVLETVAGETERNREEVRTVYLYSSGDPAYLANPTPARQRFFELLVGLVAEAQRMGLVRQEPPVWETAFLIGGQIQTAVLAVVLAGKPAQSMSEITWQVICGGMCSGNTVAS